MVQIMTEPIPATPVNKALGLILRVGVFALIAILGLYIFPLAMYLVLGPGGYFVVAALSTFAAAAVANTFAVRIYERGQLTDIGLGWNVSSRRNLALGLLGGIGAALAVMLIPILLREADFAPVPGERMHWANLLFLCIVLLFGAVGEEMLFRGYGFQALAHGVGPFATVLPVGVLFGLAHIGNQNFTALGLANTMLWGVLFGYAFLRSGDLWLPIGLHYGWNVMLPLAGENLSGLTMGVTGYTVRWKAGELWSGGAYGPEGGLPTTLAALALFFYLWKAPVRTQEAFLLRER
jgi:membrane protease YdiL (CAAX protease family)